MSEFRRPQRRVVIELEDGYTLKFIPVWREERDSYHRYVEVGGQIFECSLRAKNRDPYGEPEYPDFIGIRTWDYALDIRRPWFIEYHKEHGEYPQGISVYRLKDGTDYGFLEEPMLWTEIWERVDAKIVAAIAAHFVTARLEEEFYTE
jgi:hypothetical protein